MKGNLTGANIGFHDYDEIVNLSVTACRKMTLGDEGDRVSSLISVEQKLQSQDWKILYEANKNETAGHNSTWIDKGYPICKTFILKGRLFTS